MNLRVWWFSTVEWLCEYKDILWRVKKDKPSGKLNDRHWIDNSEWKEE